MIVAKDVEGFPVGDQQRAAEIKSALVNAAKNDIRHTTQGDTYGKGTGRGGCSK